VSRDLEKYKTVLQIRYLMIQGIVGCSLPAYIEERSGSGISSWLEVEGSILAGDGDASCLLGYQQAFADVGHEGSVPHASKATGRLKVCRSQDTSS
jgi:hypothetical protein